MWLLLAIGCGPDAPRAGEAPPAAAALVGEPDLVDVLGDCGGAMADPGPYPNQLRPGSDLHKVTLAEPTALCNDGSPAVLYVRAATDPARADDWVLHLQGGNDCVGYEECAVRWCGTGFYDASKMSSDWTPDETGGLGIGKPEPGNAFSGWNHALFYYCSSDFWREQGRAVFTSGDGLSSYAIERRGHQILEAGIAALEAGAGSDDGAEALPSILDARWVVFTGTSAGSVGVQIHLDWLRARWPAGILLGGVMDATVNPERSTVPAAVADDVEAEDIAEYDLIVATSDADPFGDASCLASVAPADAWQCSEQAFLPYGHVSAPFFARMDHLDGPSMGDYTDVGATELEFAAGVTASLDLLAALPQATVYGPTCRTHLGLESSEGFLVEKVKTHPGRLSLHGALLKWGSGQAVDVNDRTGLDSICSP